MKLTELDVATSGAGRVGAVAAAGIAAAVVTGAFLLF